MIHCCIQFDSKLRGDNALALYQYLNLKSCTWTFETFYDMSELKEICGGQISQDFEYANRGKSHVTVKGSPDKATSIFRWDFGRR